MKKFYLKGGQFQPASPGHFAPVRGGQFQPAALVNLLRSGVVNFTGFSSKVHKLIKGLYHELIENFENPISIQVKRVTHLIYISLPYEELQAMPNKEYAEQITEKFTMVNMHLPFVPRIGEHIDLSFIDSKKFTRGYVQDVRHEIMGDSQQVIIECHPYENYYYKWKELESKYELNHRRNG